MTINELIKFAHWAEEGKLQYRLQSGAWIPENGLTLCMARDTNLYRRTPEPKTRQRRIDEIKCGDVVKTSFGSFLVTMVNPTGFSLNGDYFNLSKFDDSNCRISHDGGETWEPWTPTEEEK